MDFLISPTLVSLNATPPVPFFRDISFISPTFPVSESAVPVTITFISSSTIVSIVIKASLVVLVPPNKSPSILNLSPTTN